MSLLWFYVSYPRYSWPVKIFFFLAEQSLHQHHQSKQKHGLAFLVAMNSITKSESLSKFLSFLSSRMKPTTISLANPSLPQSIQLAWNKRTLKCPPDRHQPSNNAFKKIKGKREKKNLEFLIILGRTSNLTVCTKDLGILLKYANSEQ